MIKKLICNHENGCTTLSAGVLGDFVIGWICIKCGKVWIDKERLKEYNEYLLNKAKEENENILNQIQQSNEDIEQGKERSIDEFIEELKKESEEK